MLSKDSALSQRLVDVSLVRDVSAAELMFDHLSIQLYMHKQRIDQVSIVTSRNRRIDARRGLNARSVAASLILVERIHTVQVRGSSTLIRIVCAMTCMRVDAERFIQSDWSRESTSRMRATWIEAEWSANERRFLTTSSIPCARHTAHMTMNR